MKQIFACIGMMTLFIFLTMSDFDTDDTVEYGHPDVTESREPCPEFEIPAHLTDGTDLHCAMAARAMLHFIDGQAADCILIINDGWVPVNERLLYRDEIEYLVALNGAPETRSLEEIPCEDCPFDRLERCPKCVEIHEEAYQQMAGED